MNHDDKNPDLQVSIEPELEARLVAAVLREASAFELAELERLIGEKPELGIFKRRIEAVHGLVGLAVRPEQAPMRLAPERRAKILETIGAAPARPPGTDTNTPVLLAFAEARRKRRKRQIWMSGLAASLMFAGILAVTLTEDQRPRRPDPSASVLGPTPGVMVRMEMPALEQSPSQSDRQDFVQAARSLEAAEKEDQIVLSPFVVSKPSVVDRLRSLISPSRRETASSDDARAVFSARAADNERKTASVGEKKRELFAREARADHPSTDYYNYYADTDKKPEATFSGSLLENKNIVAGYISSDRGPTSLGGTRLRTQLKDTSSALSVVTPQFMKELGAKNDGDQLLYGVGANAGVAGNKVFAAPASQVKTDAFGAASGNELVALSPFEVTAAPEKGYAASSTLSGSRWTANFGAPGGRDALKLKERDFAKSAGGVVSKQKSAVGVSPNFDDGFLSGGKINSPRQSAPVDFKDADVAPSAAAIDERLSQEKIAAAPAPAPKSQPDSPRAEISAAKEAVSTFSLHVSDVSFRLAQAALARGETPDPERIRPEEFYNAFDYGDPSPTAAEKIACRIEQAAHPLLQQRNLVRIAMKVASSGRGAGQPLNLTVLLDTSGSMEREDRIASVRRALEVLASMLGANDHVTLIGFSRQPRLLAEQLPGDQAANLADLASHTPFTGGTNLEEALKFSGELARRHHNPAAQNRIVLITDGAANLGNADPAQLATMIETLRQQGIAFDACGVGTDGLDDAILEALTRKGDGRYYVIDKPEDADAGFARQLAGAFRPAAKNVKVQVRFNPARVGSYRLIGFEQHRLREEDFRNDKVDAAELAADEAAVALYQVEVLPQGEGELGDVFVRFRDAATGNMVERSWTMLHEPHARAFDRATPTMQLAGTAALLAEKLQGGDSAKLIDLAELTPIVNTLRGSYANDARVQELITMFEELRRREGK